MSSEYFYKKYPFLYVADKVLPFCKSFVEKSTFVDFRNFFNIMLPGFPSLWNAKVRIQYHEYSVLYWLYSYIMLLTI
jgi:hypothetical protein